MTSTQEQARECLTAANVLAILVDPTIRTLNEALGGWPSEPGTVIGDQECPHRDCTNSRPCPKHEGLRTDRATADLAAFKEAVRQAFYHLRKATDITNRWGTVRDTDSTVSTKLAQLDTALWCVNCKEHGHQNVKENGNYCGFCSQFKSDFRKYNQYPPKAILDIHAYRRVNVSDVKRVMDKPKPSTIRTGSDKDAARTRRQERLGA